jgi:hypothetical protein
MMKTTTNKYVQTQQMAQECKPIPCDIPEFCRNNYFTGKLLTERDLTAEQRYAMDKLRLHHMVLHGWGVICGLRVRSHRYCPDRRVIVEPGLAVDSCGRFIRVLKEIEVELPKITSQQANNEDAYAGEPTEGGYRGPYSGERHNEGSYGNQQRYSEPESQSQQYEGSSSHRPEQKQDYGGSQEQSSYGQYEPADQSGYGGYSQTSEPTINLYFCLAYAESEQELGPAPFDECACGDSGQKPNRICETYKVIVETDKPEGWDDGWGDPDERYKCDDDDCLKVLEGVIDPCPPPSKLKCVPLAFVENYVVGDTLTEDQIDNSKRVSLHSTQFLEKIIHCLAKNVTTKKLTKIVDVSWEHRYEYRCDDFMRRFIGNDKGFEVTFEGPVRGITPRTFQAIAVRYDQTGAGLMEVAPAITRQSNDRTKALLQIDPRYAQARLNNRKFDLYIKLRTGHIVDDQGLAVDGDLLARLDDGNYSVPMITGDGVPGGLFESWIKVIS